MHLVRRQDAASSFATSYIILYVEGNMFAQALACDLIYILTIYSAQAE